MRHAKASLLATTALLLATAAVPALAGDHRTTERVSVSSADGRFVAFFSDASDLVPGDTNATGDVFVRDRGKPHAPWRRDEQ